MTKLVEYEVVEREGETEFIILDNTQIVTYFDWLEIFDYEYRLSLEPQYLGDEYYPNGLILKAYSIRLLAHKRASEAIMKGLPTMITYGNAKLRGQAFDELGDYPVSKRDVTEFLDIVRENVDSQEIIEYGALTLLDGRMDFPTPEPNNTCLFETAKRSKKFHALIQRLGVRKAVDNDPSMLTVLNVLAISQGQAPQHAPAEPTPKGSGGNTRRTKHRQSLAKELIHKLFEQYPDKSGGEICGLLESSNFVKAGWRVERHVGSVTEPDNIKKDKYTIESDQGTYRVTAGTIDTWLSNYRKKVK